MKPYYLFITLACLFATAGIVTWQTRQNTERAAAQQAAAIAELTRAQESLLAEARGVREREEEEKNTAHREKMQRMDAEFFALRLHECMEKVTREQGRMSDADKTRAACRLLIREAADAPEIQAMAERTLASTKDLWQK